MYDRHHRRAEQTTSYATNEENILNVLWNEEGKQLFYTVIYSISIIKGLRIKIETILE